MSRPGRVLPLKTIKLKEDGKMARLTHMKLRKSDGTTEIKIPPVRKILADDPISDLLRRSFSLSRRSPHEIKRETCCGPNFPND